MRDNGKTLKKKNRLTNRIQPGFSLGEMISRKKKMGGV